MGRRGLCAISISVSFSFALAACALAFGIDDITVVDDAGTPDARSPEPPPGDDGPAPPPPDDGGDEADAPFTFDAGSGCDGATAFGAPVAIGELNSTGNDVSATLSPDELTVYFASDRPGHLGAGSVYSATRAARTASFGTPALVPNVNNANQDVVNPSVTGDGKKLYLQIAVGAGAPHIYVASRASAGASFGTPVAVANVNSGAQDFLPTISLDGNTLAFSSNRANAQEFVLYEAVGSGGTFGTPAVMAGIATGVSPSVDTDPVLTADGLTLYFASERDDAAYHVYVAHRATPLGTFAAPAQATELNSPIGSGIADLPNWLSPDGCRMYLTRGAATGDLYVATRPN
ncbi:MAG TPA: hypothetical protein VIF62_37790 [Labilithrix sp.]